MLISRSRRFLFVHIQKTGGSSLREVLRARIPDLQNFLGTHDHAAWARPHLGVEWDSYYKVAFVRNPWDRLVSWYTMIGQPRPWYDQLLRRSRGSLRLWRYVHERARTFEEFLHTCTDTIDDRDGRKSFMYNQLDYVADERGELIVDFVGRFETLQQDADAVLAKLGVTDARIPHRNRSEHRHYRTYYTPDMRRLVAERYARDIEVFGYSF